MPKLKLRLATKKEGKPSVHVSVKPPKRRASNTMPNIKLKAPKIHVPTIRVKPTMVPGDGYDSEDPDREDDPLIEEGIVLRMVQDESLDALRACVEAGDMSGISVKWKDRRRAILKVNGVMYGGKLVNLPTVVEVHKSVDKKNIFKTMNVCQMLLMVKKLNSEDEITTIEVDNEYGESFPDGLTPPMKNVRDKFQMRYQEQVIQNVEDEVERLLKRDAEAETTSYEFIESNMLNNPSARISLGLGPRKKKKKKRVVLNLGVKKDAEDEIDNELDKLLSDEEEEEESAEETDGGVSTVTKARVEEEEESEQEEVVEGAVTEQETEESEDEDDQDEDEEDEEGGKVGGFAKEMDENKQHNAMLHEEIQELQATIEQKRRDLHKANNPIMRNRINDVINRLQQELDMKQEQVNEERPEAEEQPEAEEPEEPEKHGKSSRHTEGVEGEEAHEEGDEEANEEANEEAEIEAEVEAEAEAEAEADAEDEAEDDDDDLEGLF